MNVVVQKRKSWGKRIALITLLLVISAVILVGIWFFVGGGKSYIMRRIYPIQYKELVLQESTNNELDPALIFAVIRTESNFDPDAESHAGARGLMQIMPNTFSWLQSKRGETGSFTEDDLFVPDINVRYGSYYLSWLYQRYGVLETALAAYNAGPGKVDGWLADEEISADGKTLKNIPIGETRRYVESVTKYYKIYEELYDFS